jgi:hypothetical protein
MLYIYMIRFAKNLSICLSNPMDPLILSSFFQTTTGLDLPEKLCEQFFYELV